jgi:hypothetical protein
LNLGRLAKTYKRYARYALSYSSRDFFEFLIYARRYAVALAGTPVAG